MKKEYHKKLKTINETNYLSRGFINKKGYTSHILEEEYRTSNASSFGVYGVYYEEELVYIGMTMREFEDRWDEHRRNIKNNSKELKFYDLIEDESKVEFKKLIDVAFLNTNKILTERDVKSMELGLISVFKPKGNLAGNGYEYKY